MDHDLYLLTMFLEEDDSFFKYLASQDDETAIQDVNKIVDYLNFILMTLIRSKDKLEAVGHYYEPLSEECTSLFEFVNKKELRTLFNRLPSKTDESSCLKINRGYLSDFVISLIRLKRSSKTTVPPPTRYIDPRRDILFSNVLSILHENEK